MSKKGILIAKYSGILKNRCQKTLVALLAAGFLFQSFGAVDAAQPKTKVVEKFYTVTGKTGRELKAQMKRNGPKGYWAYTEWYVEWTADCKVSIAITYTMPKLANRAQVPQPVRDRWDKMVVALKKHEEGHGKNGKSAAAEIAAAKCAGTGNILKKWNRADVQYDAKTDHGFTEGVVLKD